MKGEYKRCFNCHELKPLSGYRRKDGSYFDLCFTCRKANQRQREGWHGKRKLDSWYESVIIKQGGILFTNEFGYIEIKYNMEFKLVSLADKVSEPINYRKLGFEVSDDGVITAKEIEVETDSNLTLKGLNRKDVIEKIKKLTGFPVVIGGDVWTIKNQ